MRVQMTGRAPTREAFRLAPHLLLLATVGLHGCSALEGAGKVLNTIEGLSRVGARGPDCRGPLEDMKVESAPRVGAVLRTHPEVALVPRTEGLDHVVEIHTHESKECRAEVVERAYKGCMTPTGPFKAPQPHSEKKASRLVACGYRDRPGVEVQVIVDRTLVARAVTDAAARASVRFPADRLREGAEVVVLVDGGRLTPEPGLALLRAARGAEAPVPGEEGGAALGAAATDAEVLSGRCDPDRAALLLGALDRASVILARRGLHLRRPEHAERVLDDRAVAPQVSLSAARRTLLVIGLGSVSVEAPGAEPVPLELVPTSLAVRAVRWPGPPLPAHVRGRGCALQASFEEVPAPPAE